MSNYDRAIYKTINDEIQLCLIIRYKTIEDITLFNYDRAIYKIIDDEIQLCLMITQTIYKTIDDEIQLCLIMIELYIKQLMMKYNFV